MTKDQQNAINFKNKCNQLGWNYNVHGSIVTITKSFTPGDKNGFCDCDGEYYSILSLAPLKGGSIWGTDGGGIGGMSALNSGFFKMNKSGSGKRFLNELAKL
jgi:hypothetical protein